MERTHQSFLKYMYSTSHLVIYQFQSQFMRKDIVFPNVASVSLINCSRLGVSRLLKPEIFPNLKEVHYLSGHPGECDIYRRFSPSLQWLFPNQSFGFYNAMVESGRGKKTDLLIPNYIVDYKISHYRSYFDLYIPNYCIADGQWYLSLQNKCLNEKYGNEFGKWIDDDKNEKEYTTSFYQSNSRYFPFTHYFNKRIDTIFFEHIMKDYYTEEETIKLTKGFDSDRV
jgi:hypothetical protein